MDPVLDYINTANQTCLKREQDARRAGPLAKLADPRVDVCVYFIACALAVISWPGGKGIQRDCWQYGSSNISQLGCCKQDARRAGPLAKLADPRVDVCVYFIACLSCLERRCDFQHCARKSCTRCAASRAGPLPKLAGPHVDMCVYCIACALC